MEGERGVPRNIIDERHYSDIQEAQMEGESGVTRSIIDEFPSSDMIKWKVNVVLLQMERESGVTRSIIDELHSSDIQEDQMEGQSGVT